MILEIINHSNNGSDCFKGVFPDAKIITSPDFWDNDVEKIIVPLDMGYKLIPNKILTYIPLGPFNDEYLFIKRNSMNSKNED